MTHPATAVPAAPPPRHSAHSGTRGRRRERERAARQAEELIKAQFYGRKPRNFSGSDEFGGDVGAGYDGPVLVWKNFGRYLELEDE